MMSAGGLNGKSEASRPSLSMWMQSIDVAQLARQGFVRNVQAVQ